MIINIISIILLIYTICIYVYIYTFPWFKGTLVSNDKCASLGWPCKQNAYCCRDPRKGDAFCVTKKCSSIRLVKATEDQETFFNISIISVFITLIILMILKHYYLRL